MKKIIAILLLVCVALGLASCGESAETPTGMQLAVCNGATYRLYIPKTWTPNTGSGISGGYFSQSEYSLVTVTTSVASEGQTIADRWSKCENSYKALYPTFKLVSDADTQLAEVGAHAYLYKLTYGEKPCEFLEIIALKDGYFYSLLFCFTEENYDSYTDDRDNMIENFRFADPYLGGTGDTIPTNVECPAGMKLASFDKGAYRLFVPDAWFLYVQDGQALAYVSAADKTNVGLTAYMPESDGMTLAEYWEVCQKEYQKDLQNFTVVETKIFDSEKDKEWDLRMGGRIADQFVFTATVDGVTYKYCQYVSAYASMFYVLTYTSTEALYDSHLAELEAIRGAVQLGY